MKTVKERLLDCVEMDLETGCWNRMATLVDGYTKVRIGNGNRPFAHRISWCLFVSEIPEGIKVLHKCDNRRCINPEHLFLGTQSDNMKDMAKKLRHGGAKLNPMQISVIRACMRLGIKQNKIGQMFGVHGSMITYIKNGHCWGHVKQ